MRVTYRLRRTGAAAALAVVTGGAVAACSTAAGMPAVSPRPAAAVTGAAAPPASGLAVASYAAAVRAVLPSVVLIRTADGLGSGVVLDRAGNIVTNAHVAGPGTSLQVQRAGDPAPRPAHLVGSYPGGDLAVIRAADRAGLTPAAGALLQALAAADPGQRVEITLTRAGQAHAVHVILGTLPAT